MKTITDITPKELFALKEQGGNLQLVDVREYSEYSLGHAPCAINAPLSSLTSKQLENEGINLSEPIYFICRSGGRSLAACNIISKDSQAQVINVTGGTMRWVNDGLPTSKADYKGGRSC